MHDSKAIPQGSASYGQALAAAGVVLFLALTVPLVGLLMIPAVAVATLWRTFRDFVADLGLDRKSWTAAPRG
jgi:hypothetical protein